MEVRVTNSAAQELKKKLAEKGGNRGVRVYIAGIG
jgi:Fe-S cluster assembly iron-binding protein IscA